MTVRLLVLASAVLVAVALAAGMGLALPWSTWLLIVAAMAQGTLAGAALPRFWRGDAREEVFGAGGRYVAFLAAVAFSAVEAHAVGAGIERGAPAEAAALLVLPVALAGAALRSAARRREEEPGRGSDAGTGGAAPAEAGDVGSGTEDGRTSEVRGEERGS